MKYIFKIIKTLTILSVLVLFACQDDDRELGEVIAPSNFTAEIAIVGQNDANPYGDGSGTVNFKLNADNALSYDVVFNNTSNVSTTGEVQIDFTINGVNEYNVVAIANGQGGLKTSMPLELEVLASFQLTPALLNKLTGTTDRSIPSSKTWRIKSDATAHFGLGPVGGTIPSQWFGVAPFEKNDTGMYDDTYIFSSDGTFEHITGGTVFGRVNLIDELGSAADENTSEQGDDILNLPYDNFKGLWSASGTEELININLSGLGFIGYYVGGNHTYELFQYQDQAVNEFILRTTDGNTGEDQIDWWFIITSEGGEDVVYDDLIWSDEFDVDGAPNTEFWGYDLGNGCPDVCGWGNQESQYYTDSPDNVIISEGTLKITAKRESMNGSEFTSARMLTKDKFDFTYGRVDVMAKLPTGKGTWPAIWTLGANIDEVGWPTCGEIDIMEHVGNNQDVISHALHNDAGSAGNAFSFESEIEGVSDEFHLYSINWSPEKIVFLIDNEVTFSYNPSPKNNVNWPYTADQFIILNVAMGGTLGGDIDPDFIESTMEIDYVRVYQ